MHVKRAIINSGNFSHGNKFFYGSSFVYIHDFMAKLKERKLKIFLSGSQDPFFCSSKIFLNFISFHNPSKYYSHLNILQREKKTLEAFQLLIQKENPLMRKNVKKYF